MSLAIEAGEIFSLLGPSGCGKTTTLRLIAGLEAPDAGSIFFGGQTIVSVADRVHVPTHKRNMGMVFQSYAIWPHMTVFDNVAYPLRVRRMEHRKIALRVFQTLELVGLAGLDQRPAPQLSGGQQQRVALARALVHEPGILLLDEPFSNLDAKLREQMRVQLKLLLRQVHITAVFVTHDQDEALSLSDRIGVMNAGKLEQVGAPKDVYERPRTAFVRDFLGRILLLDGVLETVDASSASVRLAEGALLRCPLCDGLETGAPVSVAIRPEDVHVGEGPLEGVVDTVLFAGDHYDCQARLGSGATLLLAMPRACPPAEGDRLRLAVAEEAITLWPR